MEVVTSAAAERNKQPILEQLQNLLPARARVLEIASGTGQHVGALPGKCPAATGNQPIVLRAISTRSTRAALRLALPTSPSRSGWMCWMANWQVPADFDALVCINMIHISPWATTPALFAGALRHLAPAGGGLVVLYGPFREGGRHTAPSNEAFDAFLTARDPRFGVRDLEAVDAVAGTAGFTCMHVARLPANNLLLAFHRD